MGTKPLNLVLPTEQDTLSEGSQTPSEDTSATTSGDVFGGDIAIQETIVDTETPEGEGLIQSTKVEGQNNIQVSPQGSIAGGMRTFKEGSGFYMARDGGIYKMHIGDQSGNSLDWDGSLKVVGKTTFNIPFTAGWDLTQGEIIAMESDGKIYPSRVKDINQTPESSMTITTGGSGRSGSDYSMVRISTTIATAAYIQSGSVCSIHRIVYDNLDRSLTSGTNTNLTTSIDDNPHCCRLSDTQLVVTGGDSTDIFAQIVSGLNTGVTSNTEITVSTNALYPHVVKYSDTKILCFYHEKVGGDLEARVLTVSGNTLSAGAAQAVYTAAGAVTIRDLKRYGDSDFFCVLFDDSGDEYALTFSYDGSSWSFGSAVDSGYNNGQPQIDSLDNTRMIWATGDVADIEMMVITRTGTATAFGSNTTITAGGVTSDGTSVFGLGADSAAINYIGDSANQCKVQLLRITGSTIALLGSARSSVKVSNTSGANFSKDIPVIFLTPDLLLVSGESNSSLSESQYRIFSMTNNYDSVIGITAEAISAQASGTAVIDGYSDDASGLTAGLVTYTGIDGKMITEEDGGLEIFGNTLSATEIKVNVDRR